VRIGVDMLAVQSPLRAARGIGRFGRLLVEALLARDDGNEVVLYVHDDLPTGQIPAAMNAAVRILRVGSDDGTGGGPHRLDHVARANPDRLDVLLVLDPFASWADAHPPFRPTHGVRLAALVHGLERFRYQDPVVSDPEWLRDYRRLNELRRYDLLLASSKAAQDDLFDLLGLPPGRVVMIGAAGDAGRFRPERNVRATPRPVFVFSGGAEDRNQLHAMLDALERLRRARLAGAARRVALVVLDEDHSWSASELDHLAQARGLVRHVSVVRSVDESTLRGLYQQSGFYVAPACGRNPLPILEAMLCGALVIVDRNGSQAGIVGDAAVLADTTDPGALVEALVPLLGDPSQARERRVRSLERARTFEAGGLAARASVALARLEDRPVVPVPTRRVRVDRAHTQLPRIAFFSPLPPKKSGIADYSASLLAELRRFYEIDLFHDAGYVPDLALASDDVFACDARLFGRYAAERDYRGIVHQMGNSIYHQFQYDWLTRVPTIVTLHDFTLVLFHLARGKLKGDERASISKELLRWYPEHEEEIRAVLSRWEGDWSELAMTCARRGWSLNREILDVSRRVIVHSPWCVDQVRASAPRSAERLTVIPMGARSRSVSAEEKAAIRARFGLPHEALVVASFGFVGPGKLLPEAALAFASVAGSDPSALFLIVGEEGDGGLTRRSIQATGQAERIRFLGRQSPVDFHALMAVTDLGINLRQPPTNGETSAALLSLLAEGVPTIVTDVGTFADFPDQIVRKVRWESDGIDQLRRAMIELASDPAGRRDLGQRAGSYVRETHAWSRVAELYARVIEECHRDQQTRRPSANAVSRVVIRPGRVDHHEAEARPVERLDAGG
jgi:glycosyltransferase involved in cell wall biosynthesis